MIQRLTPFLFITLGLLLVSVALNAQNVGIGNANPTSRLDVVGSASSDTLLNVQTTNSSSRLVVLDNGKVGIGTKEPRKMLSLSGTEPWINFDNQNGGHPDWRIGQDSTNSSADFLIQTASGGNRWVRVRNSSSNNASLSVEGQVGVGTTSPSSEMEVAGKTQTTTFQMTNGAVNGHVLRSDGSGNASWIDPGSLSDDAFWDRSSGNLYPSNTGDKVGIGTTSPDKDLHVKEQARIQMASSSSNGETIPLTSSPLELLRGSNGRGSFLKLSNVDGFGGIGANDKFLALYANNDERLRIDQNGHVGIDEQSPQAQLEVEGNAMVDGAELTIVDNNPRLTIEDRSSGPPWSVRNQNGTLKFIEDLGGASNTRVAINPNGDVGIGDPTPDGKLEVNGGKTFLYNGKNEDARIGRKGNQHISIEVQDYNAYLDYEQDSDSDGDHTFYVRNRASGSGENDIRFRTSGNDRLTITDNGRVGIGTTSPGRKLDVKGDIRLEKNSGNSWLIAAWNNGNNMNFNGPDGTILELQRDANNGTVRIGKSASGVRLEMFGRMDMNNYVLESPSAVDFNNKEWKDIDNNGALYWDKSAGLYIKSGNARYPSTGGRLVWSGANVKEGNGIDIKYDGEDLPTIKVDESQADDQNLNDVLSQGNNTGNHDIDFNSDGSINSVNNINVSSMNSNNGNSPIDFNQGISVDGSDGGGGPVIIENGKSGSGSHNANHSLALGGGGGSGEYLTFGKIGSYFGSNREGYVFEVHDEGDATPEAGVKFHARNSNNAVSKEWLTMRKDEIHMHPNGGGLVGIGTSNPTNGKVEIKGNRDNTFDYAYYARDGSNTNTGFISNGGKNYSLYASHRIAASEFNAHSDRRIKDVIGRSNRGEDLDKLLDIRVTDYTYTDTIAHDSEQKTKVIAQELEDVYPQAVSANTTEIVPDIYRDATIDNGWVQLAGHSIQTGDKVQLITEDGKSLYEVQKTREESFKVDCSHEGNVFVYGREVDNFHTVDYQALTTLNISATQALYSEKEALKTRVDSMAQHLKRQQRTHKNDVKRLSQKLEALQKQVEQMKEEKSYRASK